MPPNPHTGEGFDAPRPADAYADAPELRREMREVLALGAEHDSCRAGAVTGPPAADAAAAAERVLLLRRAALMDRLAIDDPAPGAVGAARRTAQQFAQHDLRYPEQVAGPHGPNSIEWDPSRRPYVRQEYAAWTAAGRPGA
ncbi:hypothetical protein ACFYWP_37155 [Actinacidiphila glaucinigra]|uniref:hypothetical protein n=1 Tax=Actinacidiphila glaucinigra TaxID=235986 RepID=UPI0036985AA3